VEHKFGASVLPLPFLSLVRSNTRLGADKATAPLTKAPPIYRPSHVCPTFSHGLAREVGLSLAGRPSGPEPPLVSLYLYKSLQLRGRKKYIRRILRRIPFRALLNSYNQNEVDTCVDSYSCLVVYLCFLRSLPRNRPIALTYSPGIPTSIKTSHSSTSGTLRA